MTPRFRRFVLALALVAPVFAATPVAADTVPAGLLGDWVLQTATCPAPLKFRVAATTLTLINGTDTQTWGNLGVPVPSSFFGPDYKGISLVVLPDYDKTQPFTVYFNAEEKKGVTRVELYSEMKGNMPPAVAAIQAAAKRLATRFPLNKLPLKKC